MALCSEVEPPATVCAMAAVELGLVAGERLTDLDAAVEVDDLRDVVRLQPVDEVRWPPSAASARCSSMLALLSSSSDSAIGCWRRVKNVTSCLTPSSKTEKSGCVEIGDVAGWRRR